MREEKLDTTRVFDEFVVPPKQNIRDRYTARVENKENAPGTWSSTIVIVEQHNEDGTVEDIFTYERNYSMMKTFEPFRQLKDGVWHDYALISPQYVNFEVLDLESREVIAKNPLPVITQEHHDRWKKMGYGKWCEEQPLGTEKAGWGFCPVEFYVPDWAEKNTPNSPYIIFEGKDGDRFMDSEKDLMAFTGQYALYMGCVWGDDSGGWKLRHIDLSRISEGIVTSDERYGYIQFAGKSLKEIEIWEDDRMTVPVEMTASIKTGKSFKIDANWMTEEEEDED